MDNKITAENLELLKSRLEEAIGFHLSSHSNFETVRQFIFNHTGEFVSGTTLKRIWGYLNEDVNPRISTLNIMARALGYSDWKEFIVSSQQDNGSTEDSPSAQTFGASINVGKELKKGDRLLLYWMPGRECIVKYLGNLQFEVEKAVKTHLQPGDRFSTINILEGHPLYLSNLIRVAGGKPSAYIIGRLEGGVRFRRL